MEQWSSMRCNSKVMHWPSFVHLETGWLCDWQLHLKFRKSPSSTRFFVGVSDPKQPFFEGISGVTGSNHINHTVDWKKSYTTSFLLNPFKEMGHSPYQLVIRISSIKCMCRFVLYILCSHQKYPCGTFLSSLLSEKNNKNHTFEITHLSTATPLLPIDITHQSLDKLQGITHRHHLRNQRDFKASRLLQPTKELTWLAGESPFSMGNISSFMLDLLFSC